MSSPAVPTEHTEWILETIDHLRRRKARPDLSRICHVVRRRFSLSPAETEAKLEKLVDAEVVIKVDYKGNVSYRNAARWRKSMLGCGVLNSTSISTKILQAILELSKAAQSLKDPESASTSDVANSTEQNSPNCEETKKINENNNDTTNNHNIKIIPQDSPNVPQTQSNANVSGQNDTDAATNLSDSKTASSERLPPPASGVALELLNSWLKANFDGFAFLRSPLTVILKREIDAGRVVRVPGGSCYAISAAQMAAISAAGGEIRPLKTNATVSSMNTTKKDSSPQVKLSDATGAVKIQSSVPGNLASVKLMGSKTHSGHVAQSNRPLQPGPQQLAQPSRRGRPPKYRPDGGGLLAGMALSSASTTLSTLSISSSLSGNNSTPAIGKATLGSTSPSNKLKRMLATEQSSGATAAANGPDRKLARKGSGQGELLCDFCGLSSLSNPRGEPEVLLRCKDCTAKAHPSCMKYSRLLASRACRAPWQCMDCKTCFMCQDSGHPDQMLFCDGCDRGFHMSCHRPTVTKKPSGIWECSDCRLENLALQRSSVGIRRTLTHSSAPPTPAESPVPGTHMQPEEPLSTNPTYLGEGKYPDASGWSVDDVVEFMTSAGFGQQAQLFRNQEIDGVSLLLLKRTDVLRGLDMKLGPALKINRLVQGLQTAKQGSF